MLAEIVILLGLTNIVLVYLIMRKLKEIAYPTSTKRRKKDDEEEEDEEEEVEKKEELKEAKNTKETKETKDDSEEEEEDETKEKPSKKSKSRLGRFFGKKEEKSKPHLSEMPDMNRVIEELQAEFAQKAAGAAAPISRKKTGNEIEERIDEIERM